MTDHSDKRGHKDWTHNVPYDLARRYNDMIYVLNKSRDPKRMRRCVGVKK